MKLFVLIAVAASPFLAAPAAAASAPVEPAQRYFDCVVQKHPGIVARIAPGIEPRSGRTSPIDRSPMTIAASGSCSQ